MQKTDWHKRLVSIWSRLYPYPLALWHAYQKENLQDAARSLVYMTLLTLVPLLAVAFALLSAFGVQGVIEPWLIKLFAPMGEAGTQVVEYLIRFVSQAQAGRLGAVGVAFLFVSVMGLAYKIEVVLNEIWQVDDDRSLLVRFAAYSSIVLLAPVFIGALMSTLFNLQQAAWLQNFAHLPWVGKMIHLLTGIVPVLLTFSALAMLYLWIPNCRVRWWSALCGAGFFLILWYPLSALFSLFIATSRNYSVIYSGFASVVIMLIWLNFLWLLFLLGAKVAVLVQRPQARLPATNVAWQGDEAFAGAVALMSAVFTAFRGGEGGLSKDTLAERAQVAPDKVNLLLKRLLQNGLLVKTAEKPPRYLPNKGVEHYTLLDIYRALMPQDIRFHIPEGNPYLAIRAHYLKSLNVLFFPKNP